MWPFGKKVKQRGSLICCRADEMFRIHPQTDWSHVCSKCGHKVGIYPSGQRVIQRYGKENVDIICSHCAPPNEWGVPAPGALAESAESLWNPAIIMRNPNRRRH